MPAGPLFRDSSAYGEALDIACYGAALVVVPDAGTDAVEGKKEHQNHGGKVAIGTIEIKSYQIKRCTSPECDYLPLQLRMIDAVFTAIDQHVADKHAHNGSNAEQYMQALKQYAQKGKPARFGVVTCIH